jgi:hypothetical protein
MAVPNDDHLRSLFDCQSHPKTVMTTMFLEVRKQARKTEICPEVK